MKRTISLSLAAALLVAPGASFGQETAQSPEAEAGPSKEKADDPLICRRLSVIGSRAKKRKVCLTMGEWERVAREGNAFARTVVESGRTGMWDVPPE
ncbi:hypothetical protein K3172_12610 [Qipengyuania sp. 6B39]|uniref:hypothetical protein n=1 Tax=Qipengyuania proteolytica TaxID=2867239 RepID=UPI001C89F8E2|nr:hypothetical protein [Qipengyuania proteolytica]MBX7496699.1 hypothetical protein [Qipengyuania proteolytica]